MPIRIAIVAAILTCSLLVVPSPAQERSAEPVLDRSVVSAQGAQTAQLRVPQFGRYSIRASSAQGTALQLVDRMAGPGSIEGVAGEEDGRLDVFLDRGEYRIVSHGHEQARGEAKLSVQAFTEASTASAPRLIEDRLVEESLQDLQQRSWWLEVGPRSRLVTLEAAGRSLADLRLWKDGQWLVDAAPQIRVVQPHVGRPLLVCQLHTTLEPGLYLVSAYGGPSQPWAEESDEHPLYVRAGTPRLGVAGRRRYDISPFGFDRYRVPGSATYFRLELPEATQMTLDLGSYDPARPFRAADEHFEVDKRTLPPAVESRVSQQDADRVVVVSGDAGQPYVLQHFEFLDSYSFVGEREHWVSTIHSGHAADSADATGLLIESPGSSRSIAPYREQTVELGGARTWRRRVNLLAPLTLYLNLRETTRYVFASEGVAARFRVEPFLLTRPQGYKPPDFRESGDAWNLDAGYYVLTVQPAKAGIATLTLRPMGIVDSLLEGVGLGSAPDANQVTGSVRFSEVFLKHDHRYTLYLNRQPGVTAGVIVRSLPLDLREPLPLWQKPGEAIEVAFAQAEPGALRAIAEDGVMLPVSVDGGEWRTRIEVTPGKHTARVQVRGDQAQTYALTFEPRRLDPAVALPLLPDAARAEIPGFPSLTAGSPQHLDLAAGTSQTFAVTADEPALYRLESSGLLATLGNLRTRTIPSLQRASQNGVGRNFLIQGYLGSGDYQLTIAGEGPSAGHLGVSLQKASLQRGGYLTLYRPARTTLPTGEAAEYRFIITEPGEFRVRALGQGRRLRCRLEDHEGWPLVAPNGDADVTRSFEPGHYRFIVLPEATDAKVVSLIEPVPQPRTYTGHGPHRLPLAIVRDAVWLEPKSEEPRAPDVWTFEAPADMPLRIQLSGEMRAELIDADTGEHVLDVPALRGYAGQLQKGRYRLEVVAARINSGVSYQIGVWPEPLVVELDRDVALPADLPLAVGEAAMIELSSFGDIDVRAQLLDSTGRRLAASDDRADDWNFHLASSLEPGAYRLRVDPVGRAYGSTRVSMRTSAVAHEPALALPTTIEVALGDSARLYPLQLPEGQALFLASARTDEGVGLALEAKRGDAWLRVAYSSGREARVEVPVSTLSANEPRYRLRLWSLDRRHSPVKLAVAAVVPTSETEQRLARGLPLVPVEGFVPRPAVAAVALDRPGVLRIEHGSDARWCTGIDAACRAFEKVVAVPGRGLWVVTDSADVAASARRWSATAEGESPAIPVTAVGVTVDLDPGTGPVLVRARSRVGQPGVRALAAGTSASSNSAFAAAARAAVAVSLYSNADTALLWNAGGGDANAESSLDVSVEAIRYAEVDTEGLTSGAASGALDAKSVRRFSLDRGAKRLRVALDVGLVAVLSTRGEVESVHWADAATLAKSLETEAEELTLLHAGDQVARFAIESIPLPKVSDALSTATAFEARLDRAGTLDLRVASAPVDVHVRVRGAAGEALLMTDGGRVRRGTDLLLERGLGGWLRVPHEPGLLVIWNDDGRQPGPWSIRTAAEPSRVEVPALLPLSGESVSWRVDLAGPAVLHVRSREAVIARVERGDHETPGVAVYASGAHIDEFLPDGQATLTLRAVGGELSGTAELTMSPVIRIGEGLGPEVLLAPGATRFFSFQVDARGPIGVGVRASADVVEATLLSSSGAVIGKGPAQMPTLDAGTYWLALSAPSDESPVTAQATVVGLERPSSGPPEEVVRTYLERFRESP
jgi:hypothetical protein